MVAPVDVGAVGDGVVMVGCEGEAGTVVEVEEDEDEEADEEEVDSDI